MRVRAALALVIGAAVLWVAPGVAAAHDPIIVTSDQATPDQGPAFPDGTISFAVYGTIEVPGGSAGMRVRFADGDQLDLSLLIPDLPPEHDLAAESLPALLLEAPDGTERTLTANTRVPFAEQFSGTNYVRYLELSEPAQAGEYRLTVFGDVPARFTLSFGTRETFGTPVENVVDRAGASEGIQTWYRTAPTSATPTTVAGSADSDTTVPVLIAPAPTVGADTSAPLVIAPAPSAAPESTSAADETRTASAGGTLAMGLGVLLGLVAIVWVVRHRSSGSRRQGQSSAE